MEGNLKENGWFLSSEGIAECKKACMKENPSTSECLKAAANLDLKIYGTKFLPEDINKGKIDLIKGPGVLQIQKLRNISAPRANEESSHAPRLLKFQLTDGPISCQGLEYSAISDLSLSTPPGTKICLVGSVPVRNGMLLLDDENTKVIGGEVDSLVNKWKLNKSLAKHSRNTGNTEGGPPPFVPFNHGKSREENRGRGNTGYVPNGHEIHSDSQRRQDRYRGQENAPRRGRDREEQGDKGRTQRGGDSFRGRGNHDRRNDNRPSHRENRGNRDSRGGNRNYESNTHMNTGDRYNERRTDHNRSDKNDKPSKPSDSGGDSPPSRSRSGSGIGENGTSDVATRDDDSSSRSLDGHARGVPSGRGSARGGRGGRREAVGRGRSSSMDQDESEYKARQPSEKGTIWDFVKLSIATPPNSSTSPEIEKETKQEEDEKESQSTGDSTIQEKPTETTETTIEDEPTDQIQQPSTTEQTDKRPKTDTRQRGKERPKIQLKNTEQKSKESEKTTRNQESSFGSHRDHKQRSYQQRQQQSGGQGRGRGHRGRHDDGRSYNQSLPPRLQKKQQQQYHQQHFMSLDKETRDKSSSPGSGSSSETRQSPSVDSSPSSKSSDDMKQQRRQKNYPRQQRQQSEEQQPSPSQYDTQPVPGSYLPAQQSPYHVEQQVYKQPEGTTIIPQEYNYQQPAPPPPPTQQYPVYQMQTQMGPPQAVMVTQPITSPSQQHIQTPITTAQIRWKKGNQCLALRRDGQYYSAKIEHVTPDGQQCMVSFQDFHGGCEMTSITSLRPFPIIAWTEPNAQSLPATTMTPVPIYAQPTQVAMVPRPQVMVPVQTQPPAYIAPKGPIASPSNVPPPQGLPQPPSGMHWQPAHVGYHDLRTQAYQPAMIHYDPMTQTPVRQAYYPVPPAGTVQFVRGVKELHGQDLFPHQGGPINNGTADTANKIQPTTAVYYNVKPKKAVVGRPPQAMFVTPRPQQAYEANN